MPPSVNDRAAAAATSRRGSLRCFVRTGSTSRRNSHSGTDSSWKLESDNSSAATDVTLFTQVRDGVRPPPRAPLRCFHRANECAHRLAYGPSGTATAFAGGSLDDGVAPKPSGLFSCFGGGRSASCQYAARRCGSKNNVRDLQVTGNGSPVGAIKGSFRGANNRELKNDATTRIPTGDADGTPTTAPSVVQKTTSSHSGVAKNNSPVDSEYDEGFYSASEGDEEDDLRFPPSLAKSPKQLATPVASAIVVPCDCRRTCHYRTYDPEFPLRLAPGVAKDSYEEKLAIAKSFCGYWVTVLDRSQSMDPQYRLMGLGGIKRAIMNRLAVPMSFFLEANDTILHAWLHTPIGIRHMLSNLVGERSEDEDPDAGRWEGFTHAIDWDVPEICKTHPVRAMRQIRTSEKVGTSIETRCILADGDGKIMYYMFEMIPKGKTEESKISALRILKFVTSQIDQS